MNDAVRKQGLPVPEITRLKPIKVSELEPGREPYRGRVLFCRVVTPCVKMKSVMTLVEDETGNIADLAVYNSRKAKDHLQVGRHLAIIEPFFKVRHDGSTGIRVDNPKEIMYDVQQSETSTEPEILDRDGTTDSNGKIEQDLDDSTVPSIGSVFLLKIPKRHPEMHRKIDKKEILAHRDQGNASYKSRLYGDAEASYTVALELASKGRSCNESTGDGVALWVLYSNRAMTRLKQGKPGMALQDSILSHLCAPLEASKPIVRYAQALDALGFRTEALDAIQDAMCDTAKEDKVLLKDMQRKLQACGILRVGPAETYLTIVAALNAAPPNAEILVEKGIYREPLVIDKPVIIRSIAPRPDNLVPADVNGGTDWAEIRASCFNAVHVHLEGAQDGTVRVIGFRIVSNPTGIISCLPDVHGHAALVSSGSAVFCCCSMTSSVGPIVCADGGGCACCSKIVQCTTALKVEFWLWSRQS